MAVVYIKDIWLYREWSNWNIDNLIDLASTIQY